MIATCVVCGSRSTRRWKPRNLDRDLIAEDFRITDSRYGVTLTLHRCADCSFIFADEAEIGQLNSLYEHLVDPSYEEGAENRRLQMRWLLRLGMTHKSGHKKTLLEIGSGSGLLIAEARRLGLDAVGIEPSQSLVSAAARSNGVEILQGFFPHPLLKDRRFDFVYLVDVIEHLGDPVQMLSDCASALAPGGMLLVVTPNVSSLAARILRRRWWHFRLAHVGYFSPKSMLAAAHKAGLRIESRCTVNWFFPIRYIAERVAVYVPIGPVNRAAQQSGALRRLYDRVIPLNLHDSSAFMMSRKE